MLPVPSATISPGAAVRADDGRYASLSTASAPSGACARNAASHAALLTPAGAAERALRPVECMTGLGECIRAGCADRRHALDAGWLPTGRRACAAPVPVGQHRARARAAAVDADRKSNAAMPSSR